VIHGLHGEQDLQRMGGLRKYMPSTRTTFLIATIAITGILPLSGFFSKDEILAQALHTRAFSFLTLTPTGGMRLTWLGRSSMQSDRFTAFLTSFYMWRCYFLAFSGEYRGRRAFIRTRAAGDDGPLWILAGLSVLGLLLGLPPSWVHGTALEHGTWEHFTEGVFARPRGARRASSRPRSGSGSRCSSAGWDGRARTRSTQRGLPGDETLSARLGPVRRRPGEQAVRGRALRPRLSCGPSGPWPAASARRSTPPSSTAVRQRHPP